MRALAPHTAEMARQFIVVARVSIQLFQRKEGGGGSTIGGKKKHRSLAKIGVDQFGLTTWQAQRCIARAFNEILQFA
jgi:hypothetical protein